VTPEQWVLVAIAVLIVGAVLANRPWRAMNAHRLLEMMSIGRIAEALQLGDETEARMGGFEKLYWVNVLIAAGKYRRAIEVGETITAFDGSYLSTWSLNQVNLAEADYNLGRWGEALKRLESLRPRLKKLDVMTKTGEALQRAWILAALSEPVAARAAFQEANVSSLPFNFVSEYHFTLAAVCLAEGKAADALAASDEGIRTAQRVSSLRNGLYLRARCLVALGDETAALAEFERAASRDYKYQGGDGLLAWGILLSRLGRAGEAARVWKLAIERDPESESAALAQKRLAELEQRVAL
jgi:tetratricopeptide (TPR) repeat protein